MREHIVKSVIHLPPVKPVLLYDGDCPFCLRWARRLYVLTNKKIEIKKYQEHMKRFPEIPRRMMRNYAQLIERDKNMLIVWSLLTLCVLCPLWAAADNNDDKKEEIQRKFDANMDKENQAYDQKVSDAKIDYRNKPEKLTGALKDLELEHMKKLEKLNDVETKKIEKLEH
jgi:hypothetical protein